MTLNDFLSLLLITSTQPERLDAISHLPQCAQWELLTLTPFYASEAFYNHAIIYCTMVYSILQFMW